ncbi:MAG: 5'/3'-nucleotidase SurE [Deltaproteobacteria bacterium]|nr:5'/3'-nucleotidase SurE [Deltaproteobacteria bacterium]
MAVGNSPLKRPNNHRRPLILVTNDDGVYSEGIRALAKALRQVGHVVVVAPHVERSAASHALTLHRPLRVNRISLNVYAVDGTPTDCVNLAVNEVLKQKPDLLVSGINRGANLGDDVHYSGTVSAAVEGGILGITSVAISLHARDRFRFQGACEFAVRLARKVLRMPPPAGTILNVNVPNVPKTAIRGFAFTTQGKRNYGDIVVEKLDPRGRKYYWIGGDDAGFVDIPGSDCNAVLQRMISITPVRVNLTDHAYLKKLRRWRL